MSAYSQLSGNRLPVTSAATNLYGIAAQQSGKVQALLGRADDCSGSSCPQFRSSGHAAVNLSVSVPVPTSWRSVNVSVTSFPNSATNGLGANPVPNAPAAAYQGTVAVKCGTASVTLPSFGDGDARLVTLTPAATQTSCTTTPATTTTTKTATTTTSTTTAARVATVAKTSSVKVAAHRRKHRARRVTHHRRRKTSGHRKVVRKRSTHRR
jgi:hypothetical protein